MNIIGLGRAGCQIAKSFENYEQYKVFCIDAEDDGYQTFLSVRPQNSHEDYEKEYKQLDLNACEGETTFILSGSGKISGCVLRVLEQLKHLSVRIIYIKPDEAPKSAKSLIRDKVVFGVLQQYARSALVEKMYVVSNKSVELIVGDISIKKYWHEINSVISSTYHMLNVFEKTEALLTNYSGAQKTARIGTFGVINFKTGKERAFYDLQHAREKNYFYGINKKTLDNKKVLNKIRKFIDSEEEDKVDVGFSIYSTDYDENYVYSTHYASFIQEQKIE